MSVSKKYRFEVISKNLGKYAVYNRITRELLGYLEKTGSGAQWNAFRPDQQSWEGAYYDDQEIAADKLAEQAHLAAVQADWANIEEYGAVEYSPRWHAMMAAAENADLTMQEEGGTYGDRTSAHWYEVAIASFTPVNEEPELVKVAVVSDGHGNHRVHNADCRDVAREVTKFRNGDAYVITVADRVELEEDWWGDVAGDNYEEGTPEWKRECRMNAAAAMIYLPCCTLGEPEGEPEAPVAPAEEALAPKLSAKAEAALNFLKEHKGEAFPVWRIEKETGFPVKSLAGVLNRLADRGLVSREKVSGYKGFIFNG